MHRAIPKSLLITAMALAAALPELTRPPVLRAAPPAELKTIQPPDSPPVPRWLQTTFRRSHLAAPNYEEIQAHIDAGAQLIIANLDNVFSRVGVFAADTPEPEYENANKRLREFVSYLHTRGVRAGAYCGPIHTTYWRKDLALKHPEWLQIGPDGKPRFPTGAGAADRGPTACTYGPYGDVLIRHLSMLARDYGLDAFWFDGNNFPLNCMCPSCKESYRKATGQELEIVTGPSSDPKARRFIAWRYQNYIDFMTRVTRAVRKANPECTIHFNYSSLREWGHGPWFPEYPAMYASSQDCPSTELWWHLPGDAIHQSIVTQYMRAAARERPTAIWVQPQAHGIMGVSSPVEIRSRSLNAIANGAVPELVEATGRREYVFDLYKVIKEREEYLVDVKWLKWGAMLVSEQTRMFYGADRPMERYMESVFGGFKAIQEEHLPVRLITEQDIEDGGLAGYRVLYLPNSACLSDQAISRIKAFVKGGGGLVASQFASLYDGSGSRRQDFALADLFHARYTGAEEEHKDRERPAYFVPVEDEIAGDPNVERCETKGWGAPRDLKHGTIPVTGTIVFVDPSPGGTAGARFRKMLPEDRDDRMPVYVSGSYSKGRVVYFPIGLEKHCYNYGDPFARRMIRNALLLASAQPPPVAVHAPAMLQTTFYEQKDKHRLVIHLLNDQSSWGRHSLYWQEGFGSSLKTHTYPQREEVIPLRDLVSVTIRGNIRRVSRQPGGIRLKKESVPGGVRVKVPEVGLHSMVVVEYAGD